MTWDTALAAHSPSVWVKWDASPPTNYGSLTLSSSGPVLNSTGTYIVNQYGLDNKQTSNYAYVNGGRSLQMSHVFASNSYYGFNEFLNKNVTMGVWFRKNGVETDSNNQYPMILRATGDYSSSVLFILPSSVDTNNAGRLVYNITSQNNNGGGSANVATSADNQWHHAAITISGNTVTYYYDGVSMGTSSLESGGYFRISGIQVPATYPNHLNGDIDDFYLIPQALTSTQMAALHASVIDYAPLKFYNGGSWVTPSTKYFFNGNNFIGGGAMPPIKVWNGSSWLNVQ
jgi:hypothetical protein